MSDAATSPNAPASWTPLPMPIRRVVGVLIEKEKTHKTADAYPMTVNAVMLGCNQKSNRDPVLEMDEVDVEEALIAAQKLGLVMKLVGGRTEKWRHLMYDIWKITKYEMAIMAELLLRGAQSEGDLRGRASRMNDIPDLDELRRLLQNLASRNLVIYLTPPERRGAIVTHGFHTPDELSALRNRLVSSAEPDTPNRSVVANPTMLDELQQLKERVSRLEAEVAALKAR